MSAERRSMLRRVGLVVGVGALAAPVLVSVVHPAPLNSERFASIDAALKTLEQLKTQAVRMGGAWDMAHVLHHAAQSIEYSISGFPEPKPAWFRATVGSYAFALFNARGQMTHKLSEPIPGAPDIAQGQPLAPAIDHAIAALQAFERHSGALAPHFAYGALDKPDYTRAHLMHLANHWAERA
ncbi:MAG: DUF1569 domain-containing protein [Burkholderiaceae bacterium]